MSHKTRLVEVIVRDRGSDFEAMARAADRWKKLYEEMRDRVAYMEGAILGMQSSKATVITKTYVESILAHGPGKRQVG